MNRKWNSNEIRQLKECNPIARVAAELGIDVVRGRARCLHPHNHSHGDRTPSMSISDTTGTFKCWVCDDVKGDVIELVKNVKQCSFGDALEWLNSRAPVHRIDAPLSEGSVKVTRQKIHFEMDPDFRNEMILQFLKLCTPVDGAVLKYLVSRKIYRNNADALKLRMIGDYQAVQEGMKKLFSMKDLQSYGFFSENNHLRFYKHPLIFPYVNKRGLPVYFQARAIESGVQPKELNIKGSVPLPYNAPLLDGKPGVLFLCEGVIDTLTLVTKKFPAVGVPGVNAFKKEWFELFVNKHVFIAFDADEAGKNAAERLKGQLLAHKIQTSTISLPEGEDINEWFAG